MVVPCVTPEDLEIHDYFGTMECVDSAWSVMPPCMVSQTTKNLESLHIWDVLPKSLILEMIQRENRPTCSRLPRTITSFASQNPPPGFKPLRSKIFDIDANVKDPLVCPDIAKDVFENLFLLEEKQRPRKDYMWKVQKHINSKARAKCIDWLVGVAERLNLFRDTLHLAVNYLDRYLSGNEVDQEELWLVGLTCMMVASKYEEMRRCRFNIESYIYLAKGMLSRDDFIKKERSILSYLNYDVTTSTTWSFLERFLRAAQGFKSSRSQRLECMVRYIVDLSLLSYRMLQFLPSMIAASSVLLAQYILFPDEKPWSATLQHYTHYKLSDLRGCVLALNESCIESCSNHNLLTIRSKYSQERYHSVALKSFPVTVPLDFVDDL